MVSHAVNRFYSWHLWSEGKDNCEGGLSVTDFKVKQVGATLQQIPKQGSDGVKEKHCFSPLRLLFWACLFSGVRAQLTDPFPAQFDLSSLDGKYGFVINGEAANDMSSTSVSSAGDVNGDGVDDIVIGAFKASPSGRTRAGRSYVIFGNRMPINSGVFELSSLNGVNGFIINGEAAEDQSGISVSSAGDVNGDGVADLVIGAYLASPSGRTRTGKSYVIFGSRTPINGGVLELSSLIGTNGFILNGEARSNSFGSSVSIAGDVNGDGIADLVIGARGASPSGKQGAGKSYLIYGSRTTVSGGVLEVSSLKGSNGFRLNGEAAKDSSGGSVSIAGDVNGDGVDDFVIGAFKASPSGRTRAGRSYVIYGSRTPINSDVFELSSLNGANGFIINGEAAEDQSGNTVSSAGDVNGDGVADLVIGAYWASPSGRTLAGKSYVIFGSRTPISGGVLDLSTLDGTNGFILNGEAANDYSGYPVSSAGDVNGDGVDDLVIGAYGASPSGRSFAGKSYVVYGSRKPISGGIIELSSLDGSNGFILNGEAADDYSGLSVSSAGDVNGDGVADLVIGAQLASPLGRTNAGKSYVIYGRQSATISTTVIIGVATTVGLLACSLFIGMIVYLKRRISSPTDEKGTILQPPAQNLQVSADFVAIDSILPNMRSARVENNYDLIPQKSSKGHYKTPPQEQPTSKEEDYDKIDLDQENQAMNQYQAAKRHENYDDLPNG